MELGSIIAIGMNVGTIVVGAIVSVFRLGKRVRQSQESEDKVKQVDERAKTLEGVEASIERLTKEVYELNRDMGVALGKKK
jgi:hypothetical protein